MTGSSERPLQQRPAAHGLLPPATHQGDGALHPVRPADAPVGHRGRRRHRRRRRAPRRRHRLPPGGILLRPANLDHPGIRRSADFEALRPLAMAMASAGLCADYSRVVKCLLWADVGRVAVALVRRAGQLDALRLRNRDGDWVWVVRAKEGTLFAGPESVQEWLQAGIPIRKSKRREWSCEYSTWGTL